MARIGVVGIVMKTTRRTIVSGFGWFGMYREMKMVRNGWIEVTRGRCSTRDNRMVLDDEGRQIGTMGSDGRNINVDLESGWQETGTVEMDRIGRIRTTTDGWISDGLDKKMKRKKSDWIDREKLVKYGAWRRDVE